MSDKPKFSLLNHMRETQKSVESPKQTQTVTPDASDMSRFRPATASSVPRFKPAGSVESDSKPTVKREVLAETASVISKDKDESPSDRGDVPTGVSTSLVSRSLPTGGLTHQLEAMKLRAESGKKALEALYITDNQPFNELLERLDSLFDQDLQLDDFNVQPARDIVEVIMKQLKEDPNLDGMMIDKDAANIISFVRKVKGVALNAATEKKEKAVKTASNKDKKSIARFDTDSLEGLNFAVPVKKSLSAPSSLADVANIDIDKLKF